MTPLRSTEKYGKFYGIAIRSDMLEEYLDKRFFHSFKYVQIYLTINVHTSLYFLF